MKNFNPMNIETFNQQLTEKEANCMLFAFSQTKKDHISVFNYNLWGFRTKPIKEIVEKAGAEFGGLKLRKIDSLEVAPKNKYLIGFYLKTPKDDEYGEYDYHFIRRELDGTWVEKPDWLRQATTANLSELRIEFGMEPILFVVEGVL